MESTFDGILITVFGTTIELQQSILNWLILCVIFTIFFIVAGKKFEKADVRKAPDGILLLTEMITGLCTNIIGDNLKEKTRRYLPFMGTLIMMMAVSNLLGLIGLQPPTSNLSFNVTLALLMFFLIQYNGIKKGGLGARLKELTEPMWLLTPLNVIGELALPISLSMRLFGNILAGSIIMLLVYTMLKALLPFGILIYIATPFLHAYFDIFSGMIQTYIFFTLASFFLSEQVVSETE
ncbi:MAG: F0F1 ATP synthase subunit A [Erysipelotrichaceae bacterium]|nr:F0F1 ATP synthase subunit A [Erysipelotrichaceae bacterium]MCI9524634.1 F0F1 ATP synthase subunit A [Erysipelotrichaceae bacterium]